MKQITPYIRECGRSWRHRRRLDPKLGYMLSMAAGALAYRNLARTLPRAGAFISLDSAAECRRHGGVAGKRFARWALERARTDDARWRAAGGHLP